MDYEKLLQEIALAKAEAKNALVLAQRVENELKHEMELEHVKLNNRLDSVQKDVSSHRSLWIFLGSAFGVGIVGGILKAMGL